MLYVDNFLKFFTRFINLIQKGTISSFLNHKKDENMTYTCARITVLLLGTFAVFANAICKLFSGSQSSKR